MGATQGFWDLPSALFIENEKGQFFKKSCNFDQIDQPTQKEAVTTLQPAPLIVVVVLVYKLLCNELLFPLWLRWNLCRHVDASHWLGRMLCSRDGANPTRKPSQTPTLQALHFWEVSGVNTHPFQVASRQSQKMSQSSTTNPYLFISADDHISTC